MTRPKKGLIIEKQLDKTIAMLEAKIDSTNDTNALCELALALASVIQAQADISTVNLERRISRLEGLTARGGSGHE